MSFRQTIILVVFSAVSLWALSLHAQKKGAKKAPVVKVKPKTTDTVATKKVIRNFLPDVYLGQSNFSGGIIRKKMFDSLMKQGLSSHDSMGNKYKVMGFDFIYGERNLYEDSTADLHVITDYLMEYCPGDTVSKAISTSIYDRTKNGDTIFIDKIKVARLRGDLPDSFSIVGRPVKCVIVK